MTGFVANTEVGTARKSKTERWSYEKKKEGHETGTGQDLVGSAPT